MTVSNIQKIMESWAPPDIAWERDSVGLQVGSPQSRVRGILVSLDVTEGVIREAARRRANLLVSHHPLFFKPLSSVTPGTTIGRCVEALVRQRIALYAAHTNLDFTKGGTSFVLAEALGVTDPEFLHMPYQLQKKIVTFVPPGDVDRVAGAMAKAGAGSIGNYESCSFRLLGTGTFCGNEASNPTVGKRGVTESVQEVRLEMIAPRSAVEPVVRAMKLAHPYEEVAYDVYPLDNRSSDCGMGVIGDLPRSRSLRAFVADVQRLLGTPHIRYTGRPQQVIRRVAVCGGAGADLAEEAIRKGADAFVTADVKYHAFRDCAGRLALLDAGHYETERPVVRAVVMHLKRGIRQSNASIPVAAARTATNPIDYVDTSRSRS